MSLKKILLIWAGMVTVYAAVVAFYFLSQGEGAVPGAMAGGPADPATFMSGEQIHNVHRLSTIEYISFFISTPIKWTIMALLLALGVSAWFRDKAEDWFRLSGLRLIVFLFLLQVTLQLIELPLDYYLHSLNRAYGLSNQAIGSWLGDQAKSLVIDYCLSVPLYGLLLWAIKKSPQRWWLWGWIVSIPLTLFFTFVQPIVLDPVFNEFKPLQDEQLRQKILKLADEAGIPANQVYQVDKSKQTNTLNAYVSGIGASTRIVLWDTTLQKLKKDEILFIMAHEMGHYVKHHVLWGTLYGIAESLTGFWLVYRLYRRIHSKFGTELNVRGPYDMASLPVLFLLTSVLTFAASPLDNAISRMHEHSADQYAISLTQDKDAGIRAFQQLAANSLSDVNPPSLVQWFLGSHPTLAQRIDYVQHYPVIR
ncbi:M48 family metallopeptidase [Paenibacillus hamazuiensis]|uniref:M48 family metallopeptidase n=1 Tax=Paenibacillus hamazuiensis TaxID=2936508 RepID=UPI00200EFF48|nr:M48 family metallopeptidase [Paenibacillus hamazuiensis]